MWRLNKQTGGALTMATGEEDGGSLAGGQVVTADDFGMHGNLTSSCGLVGFSRCIEES